MEFSCPNGRVKYIPYTNYTGLFYLFEHVLSSLTSTLLYRFDVYLSSLGITMHYEKARHTTIMS